MQSAWLPVEWWFLGASLLAMAWFAVSLLSKMIGAWRCLHRDPYAPATGSDTWYILGWEPGDPRMHLWRVEQATSEEYDRFISICRLAAADVDEVKAVRTSRCKQPAELGRGMIKAFAALSNHSPCPRCFQGFSLLVEI